MFFSVSCHQDKGFIIREFDPVLVKKHARLKVITDVTGFCLHCN